MATLDWFHCSAVESVPRQSKRCVGVPQYPPARRHRDLEDMSVDEVMEQSDVTRERIEAVLEFVVRN